MDAKSKIALVGVGALLLWGTRRPRRRRSKSASALQVGKSFQQLARAQSYPYRARAVIDEMQLSTGRKLPLRPGAFSGSGLYPDFETHELAIKGKKS